MAAISGTVAAVAGVASAAVGVYSSYESKKQADKQYAAQQAAFANDIEAAITNAQWMLKDTEVSYLNDSAYADQSFDIKINQAWDMYAAKDEYIGATTALKQLVNTEMADADIEKFQQMALTDLKKIAEQAQLDADYAIAMGQVAADYYTTKAAIDATERLNMAQAALQFVDQDINTLRTQLASMKEVIDVEKADALGKEILNTSNSLAMGNSTTRRMMSTMIKADAIGQAKTREVESAIDKAYATQSKTTQDTAANVTNIFNTGVAMANRETTQAIQSAMRTLNTAKLDSTVVMENLTTTVNNIRAINAITNRSLQENMNIEQKYSFDQVTADVSAATAQKQEDDVNRATQFDQTQYQTFRGLLKSLETQRSAKGGYDISIAAYANTITDPKWAKYVEQAREEGTLPYTDAEFADYAMRTFTDNKGGVPKDLTYAAANYITSNISDDSKYADKDTSIVYKNLSDDGMDNMIKDTLSKSLTI